MINLIRKFQNVGCNTTEKDQEMEFNHDIMD